MSHPEDLFVWPDGSFVFRNDYEDVIDAWRGSDYRVVTFESIGWFTILSDAGYNGDAP